MKRMAALLAVMGAMAGVVPAQASAADGGGIKGQLCSSLSLLGVRIC